MADLKNLRLERRDGVIIITVSRESKLNALNIETVGELRHVMQVVYDDPKAKAVIITGEGDKAFVAGADIEEIADLNEFSGRKFSENGQEVFAMIEGCNKPVIAAVNGFALGGGCELAMACHIRVATTNAKFGQPEVNLGIIPGYGGTQRLTHLIGKSKAYELMMTGDMISASEAKELGLVNYVVDSKEAMFAKCYEILDKIMTKAPIAVSRVIDCINAVYNGVNGYQIESNSFANCCKTEDFKEGVAAFLEKRKADFHNK